MHSTKTSIFWNIPTKLLSNYVWTPAIDRNSLPHNVIHSIGKELTSFEKFSPQRSQSLPLCSFHSSVLILGHGSNSPNFIPPENYWTSPSMTPFFFFLRPYSLSCVASSFSIDIGKLNLNLKSFYDHSWQTQNKIRRNIFGFFHFMGHPLSGVLNHNLEIQSSILVLSQLFYSHCLNIKAWYSSALIACLQTSLYIYLYFRQIKDPPLLLPNKMTISPLSPIQPSQTSLPSYECFT